MRAFELFNENSIPLSTQQLIAIEEKLDQLWASLGIDIEFTYHWKSRVNDIRNQKQITADEIVKIFNDVYQKYGKQIAQTGPDFEAVLQDISTDINIPFVLNWNRDSEKLELVAKTIMRKSKFQTSDPVFQVESSKIADHIKIKM